MEKAIQKKLSLVSLLAMGVMLMSFLALAPKAYAAGITISVDPDTATTDEQEEGYAGAEWEFQFTVDTAIPVDGEIIVTFPSEFTNIASGNVTATVAPGTATLAATGTGNTVTLTVGTATLAATTDTVTFNITGVTNPTHSGEYYIGILTADDNGTTLNSGAAKAEIGNSIDDQEANVMITGQIYQQCTMDLGTADVYDLGILAIDAATTTDGNEHLVSVNCNVDGSNDSNDPYDSAFSIQVTDNGGFAIDNSDASKTFANVAAHDTDGNVAAGEVGALDATCTDDQGCFGMKIENVSVTDTDFICDADLTGTDYTGTTLAANAIKVCGGKDPVSTSSFDVEYGVYTKADAPAGIYNNVVYYTLNANF